MSTGTAKVNLEEFIAAIRQRNTTDPQSRLLKLEISKPGELMAQLRSGDAQTWVKWSKGEIVDLDAGLDTKIPLAVRLSDKKQANELKILNYRPGHRLVLLDRGGQTPRVIKGFRKRRLEKTTVKYEIANAAFSGRYIHTPKILEINEELSCLSMVYERGEPLCLSANDAGLFGEIGIGLSEFQTCTTQVELDVFSIGEELNVIDRLSARLTRTGLDLPEKWTALRDRLESAEGELPRADFGLCHRDLYDKQFIQHRMHIALLDFDLMCRADVALDPANFLAHLALRKLQGVRGATQNSIDICSRHFLQGLGRNKQAGFQERLEFYQATTFCRLALVYSLRPPWVSLVPDLIAMGNRCLENLLTVKDS